MATITWLGEEGNDLKEMTWRNIKFEKDKAVEVTDKEILAKAMGNKYFKVEGYSEPPPGEGDPPPTTVVTPAPSTQSAQRPAPKPGEPVQVPPVATPAKS